MIRGHLLSGREHTRVGTCIAVGQRLTLYVYHIELLITSSDLRAEICCDIIISVLTDILSGIYIYDRPVAWYQLRS